MRRACHHGSRLPRPARVRERGVSLLVTLIILLLVLLLGAASSQFALQDERAARIDRDRAVAFHAAEAALQDAQLDLAGPSARSAGFGPDDGALFAGSCAGGSASPALGLCAAPPDGASQAWMMVDFLDDDPATARSVAFGQFTGASFQSGAGALPARAPRYVIERVRIRTPGADASTQGAALDGAYRITAIGFGSRVATQVVLQTLYHKPAGP